MTDFVYRVAQMDLHDFHAVEDFKPWEVGDCVRAVFAVREKFPEVTQTDGDFWITALPMKSRIVVWRLNPFSEGYVVSPVELPWLEKKSEGAA